MAASCTTGGKPAKIRGGETCTSSSDKCAVSQSISDLFRLIYPAKTWSVIGNLLGLSERSAKYRVAAVRPYTVEELRTILRGEDGVEFYEMLMEGSTSEAWKYLSKEIRLSRARRKQAEAAQEVLAIEDGPADPRTRRQLRKYADADRRLNSAFAEKETAVGFSRPDFPRGLDRSMAETQKAPPKRAYAGRSR